MAIVKSKPTSPGRRGLISVKSDLYKGKPHKSLIEPKSKNCLLYTSDAAAMFEV